MNITEALSVVILIVMGIGTGTLGMALRPNSKISLERLGNIMTVVMVIGLSAALALLVTVILPK